MPKYGNFYTAMALSICPYSSSFTPKEFEQVVLDSKLNSSGEFSFDHYRSHKMANLSLCYTCLNTPANNCVIRVR